MIRAAAPPRALRAGCSRTRSLRAPNGVRSPARSTVTKKGTLAGALSESRVETRGIRACPGACAPASAAPGRLARSAPAARAPGRSAPRTGFDPPRGRRQRKRHPRGCLIRISGGDEGDRTPDLLTASQALSQLSYAPKQRIGTMHHPGCDCKESFRKTGSVTSSPSLRRRRAVPPVTRCACAGRRGARRSRGRGTPCAHSAASAGPRGYRCRTRRAPHPRRRSP